ncbi:site-specific integrase [Paraburkholderia strydomiana]|uniref:site-specific integrase n=1 Tax=Paraburkholderia strydomiana TaxID=1245417 RepID=UPI002865AD8A|nr:site-specific integrase [Paraburkholderia strydomiana]MDR7008937.1 site-specific recombinase XerD [Paraburkholderia strydomiana]
MNSFASAIRNPHTRRAYARTAGDFLTWCARRRDVHHRGAAAACGCWIELQTQSLSAPTVKQRLATIRRLFDWLVTGHRAAQPGRVGAGSQS